MDTSLDSPRFLFFFDELLHSLSFTARKDQIRALRAYIAKRATGSWAPGVMVFDAGG
jgi:hypothetical protein